jgi:hypothetical protein
VRQDVPAQCCRRCCPTPSVSSSISRDTRWIRPPASSRPSPARHSDRHAATAV